MRNTDPTKKTTGDSASQPTDNAASSSSRKRSGPETESAPAAAESGAAAAAAESGAGLFGSKRRNADPTADQNLINFLKCPRWSLQPNKDLRHPPTSMVMGAIFEAAQRNHILDLLDVYKRLFELCVAVASTVSDIDQFSWAQQAETIESSVKQFDFTSLEELETKAKPYFDETALGVLRSTAYLFKFYLTYAQDAKSTDERALQTLVEERIANIGHKQKQAGDGIIDLYRCGKNMAEEGYRELNEYRAETGTYLMNFDGNLEFLPKSGYDDDMLDCIAFSALTLIDLFTEKLSEFESHASTPQGPALS